MSSSRRTQEGRIPLALRYRGRPSARTPRKVDDSSRRFRMSSSDKGQEAGLAARKHKTSRPTLKTEAGAGHSPEAGTAINDVARSPGRPFLNVVFLAEVSANDDQVRTHGDATKRRFNRGARLKYCRDLAAARPIGLGR